MNAKERKILDAAVRLFIAGGVKKVTMDEIAASAKTSKMTVYKYFTDKDTLYLHTGRYILKTHAAALAAAAALDVSLMQRFYAALDAVSTFADDGMYALCLELAEYNLAVEGELRAYREASRDVIYALISQGVGAGYLRNDLSREMIYYYIDMSILYYQQNAQYREKLHADTGFRTGFMRFFVGNIFVDGAAALENE